MPVFKIITIVLALSILSGCGISISPIPGVSIYIPLPHEIGKKDHTEDDAKHELHPSQ